MLVLGLGIVAGLLGAAPAAANQTVTARSGFTGSLVANTLQSSQVGITLGVANKTATGFRVNWSEVPGSTGYRVTRSAPAPGESIWTGTDPATARGRDILWLKAGYTYTVSVEALPSGAKGTVTVPVGTQPGPPVTSPPVTPPPAAGITVGMTNKTATGFRVNWSEVPGSTGYRVTRSAPAPGESIWTGTDPATARSRDILWLKAGYTYTVGVEALPSGAKGTVTVPMGTQPPVTQPPVTQPPVTPPTGGNKYGFMVFLGNGNDGVDKDIAGIVAAGGGWARLGMYNSGSFTAAGVFQPTVATWETFKYAAKKARSSGLKVLWDAADTLRISNSLTNAQWIAWQSSMWRYMAKELGPWVDAWQVFNEHDVRDIRTFAPVNTLTDANLAFFRDALQGARNAIREHSQAPVGTTVFGYPMNEERIQRWFRFHDVVSAQMDFIGIHAYPEFNGPILTSFVQRTYDRYKKPIAVLEFGVPDAGGYGTAPQYLRVGDGIVIQNDALLAVKDKLLCATLFSLRNRVQGGTGEGGFGILDNNWARKAYWQKVVDSIAKW